MKSKPRQYEMDLGREPFALVSEVSTDHARVQIDAVQRESNRAKAARRQWWFDQMHATVERVKGGTM